ncbi:MAG: hypothetical protein IIA87_00745 [Nanoarchaeota archaeon]|nr:hypothetical protein [Nanoarchaeota archaeon]
MTDEKYRITETMDENPNSPDWMLTGFISKKVALFPAGSGLLARKEEKKLLKKGVYAIAIRNPNKEDVQSLNDFNYGPIYVTWHAPTSTYLDRLIMRTDINEQERRRRIRDYRKKINTTKNYSVTTNELTDKNFKEWYLLYEKFVLSKKYGLRLIPTDFLKQIENVRDNFYEVIIKDTSGKMVAGLILELISGKGILKIKGSVSDNSGENRRKHFILRAQEEVYALAKKLGLKIMSYGTDTAYYGEAVSIGLEKFKASLGYQPTFCCEDESLREIVGATQLIKVLDKDEPYILFTFSNRNDKNSRLEIKKNGESLNYSEPWLGIDLK